MSDSPNERPATPINVPATRPASRRAVSFSHTQRRVNFDSIYDPIVTAESQEAHGEQDENTDTIENQEAHGEQNEENNLSTFPRRIKKGQPSPSPRLTRSQSLYGTPHSLAWSALRQFSEGMPMGTPSSIYSRTIYDEPTAMSPGEGSLYSVIVDDGSLQRRRRISLNSECSRRNVVTEQTPLLHGCYGSDSDIEDVDQSYNRNHNDTSLKAKIGKVRYWISKNKITQSQKNIIKCALAYFLTSLFTFFPILNDIAGLDSSQNHLISSVAVFFNPAKTVGGMYEAVLFAFLGGLYGSLIGIGSMASAVWFNDNNNYILGHIVTVVVWCGGSMFIVAYFRAKLNKPTFNSACSLANIIIFVVITKEGASYIGEFTMVRIIQVTKIVLIGICISFLVSVCVWPVRASKKLKTEIGETLKSFRLLLKLLTKTFLIDDIRYTDQSVQSAIKSHQATFTSLKGSLREASHEIYDLNMQRQFGTYKEIIDSLQRLAQYLGGLRSCCGLQWEIIKDDEKINSVNSSENLDNRSLSEENSSDDEEEFVDLGNLLEIIQRIGPSMKSLAFTCKQTMSHIQDEFIVSPTFSSAPSFTLLRQNLRSALDLFEKSQTRSFTALYRKKTNNLDNRPNEEIFLTYFFVFNLQEFTKELMNLVDLVDRIQKMDSQRRGKWWQFWLHLGWVKNDSPIDSTFDKKTDEKIENKFPENTSNLFNTVQTPMPKTLLQKITIKIWKSLSWFRQYVFKYALKAAISTIILTAPAFIDRTRSIYTQYRGEWACISMMVVMVPTVGGANLIAIYRAGGTLFGSILACIIYTLFSESGLVMSIVGFFIALGCYYVILNTKYNRMGQFILLTYNLVALFKFNLKNTGGNSLDIIEIARYRTIAVVIGIIWGVYVTAYWWPYEARAELRKGLSQLIINMSWLYNKLVFIYSDQTHENDAANSSNSIPHSSYQLTSSSREFMEMELFLQLSLIKLKELLSQTPNEPRMKGPFPVESYNKIIVGCQNILDKLLSMRIAVTKEEWYTSIRRNFLFPISKERKDLVGSVLLYFYILAAALRLKTPLPPYLPPAEKARRRLVKKIRDLPVVRQRVVEKSDVQYIIYYAYVLVMEDIIRELEKLGEIMKELFGCIGGDDFNDLFKKPNHSMSGSSDGGDDYDDASGVAPRLVITQDTGDSENNKFDEEFGTFIGPPKANGASQNDAINKSTD